MLTFLRKFKSVLDIYYPCEATVRLLEPYDKADYKPLARKGMCYEQYHSYFYFD